MAWSALKAEDRSILSVVYYLVQPKFSDNDDMNIVLSEHDGGLSAGSG